MKKRMKQGLFVFIVIAIGPLLNNLVKHYMLNHYDMNLKTAGFVGLISLCSYSIGVLMYVLNTAIEK